MRRTALRMVHGRVGVDVVRHLIPCAVVEVIGELYQQRHRDAQVVKELKGLLEFLVQG